ncbi:MAG: Ig-like domain-containing protein [Spirochaetes bacterium]|nr:Ig-like domain-containing protein [Spirochaetota bacterium]
MKTLYLILILFITSFSCQFRADLFEDASTKVDSVSPVIISHNLPLINSAPNSFSIRVRFSEQLDAASVSTDSVILTDNSKNKVTNIDISYDSIDNSISIIGVNDSNNLTRGKSYTLTITTEVSDIVGNNLIEDFTGNLSIAESPQIPGTNSIWTSNYDDGYFVESGDKIYIPFSENITTSLSSADIVSRTTFNPSPSFTSVTAVVSDNFIIYTIGSVGTNADTYCTIDFGAGDFKSTLDGTDCKPQIVNFTVLLKAVKD